MNEGSCIDLHTHSTASDGSMSPDELVRYAGQKGLAALALTDHDTIDGVSEALAAGKKYGVEVISGLETTTVVDGCDVHIVCLFFDPVHPAIQNLILTMEQSRGERNRGMVRQLEEAGIDIHWEDFSRWEGRAIAKAHVAHILIERGYAADLKEALAKYMAKGTAGYVKWRTPPVKEVIGAVHESGGLAVVAHINQIDKENWPRAENVCRLIFEAGADGVETLYCDYDDTWRSRAEALRVEYKLLASGGSDFHGSFKPSLDLGSGFGSGTKYGCLAVPYSFLEEMKRARAARLR